MIDDMVRVYCDELECAFYGRTKADALASIRHTKSKNRYAGLSANEQRSQKRGARSFSIKKQVNDGASK